MKYTVFSYCQRLGKKLEGEYILHCYRTQRDFLIIGYFLVEDNKGKERFIRHSIPPL